MFHTHETLGPDLDLFLTFVADHRASKSARFPLLLYLSNYRWKHIVAFAKLGNLSLVHMRSLSPDRIRRHPVSLFSPISRRNVFSW